MNDPVKDFVEQHREEFDYLEAPALKLDQLKAKIQRVPETRKRSYIIFARSWWMIAATVLITLTCAGLFFYSGDKDKPVVELARQKTKSTSGKAEHPGSGKSADDEVNKEVINEEVINNDVINKEVNKVTPINNHLAAGYVKRAERQQHEISLPASDVYGGLKDSTSASTRLLAILEIERSGKVSNHLLDMLAATLNNDPNTNVRLAALSLMEKYRDDGHVASLLVSSLDKQGDPMVQLGLVSLIGKMKNIKIDDKLELLASSPETFAAVRDEAYSILLNQNKL